jgi:hypothetical protein
VLCCSSVKDHSGYSPSSRRAPNQNPQQRCYTSHGSGALARLACLLKLAIELDYLSVYRLVPFLMFANSAAAAEIPRSTFHTRHSSAYFRVRLESLGAEEGPGSFTLVMTSQKLHEMLIGLYLELGLSLQDALRAAEADLKQLASQLSASEMSSFFGSEGPFHRQHLLQFRKSASSRSDRLKFPAVVNLL